MFYPFAFVFLAIIVLTLIGMFNGPLLGGYSDFDGFSLAWGLVVMIYAFVSMIACVELPREQIEDIRFKMNKSVVLNGMHPATMESMSVNETTFRLRSARSVIKLAINDEVTFEMAKDFAIRGTITKLDVAGLQVAVSYDAVLENRSGEIIHRDPEIVRQKVIGHLFSQLPVVAPPRAVPRRAARGVFKRMFAHPLAVVRPWSPIASDARTSTLPGQTTEKKDRIAA